MFSFSRFEWCPNNFSSRANSCPGERFVLFNNKPILSVSISIQVTLPCESPKLHVRRLEWRCRGCFSISASKESRLAGADTRFRLVCLSFVTRAELKSFHLGKMKLSLFNDCPKYLITNKKFVLVKIKLKRKSLLLESKVFYVKKWESYWDKERNTKSVQRELLAWLKAYDRYPHLENSLTFTFLIIISYHLSSSQVIFIRLCQNTYNAGKGLIFQSGLASNWCVSYTCFLPKYLSVVEMILSLITLCLFQAGCAWEQCHNVAHLSW